MNEVEVILKRIHKEPRQTLGQMVLNNEVIAHTLELPWRNNAFQISCIPHGRYKVIKHKSPKFGNSFWVLDVPNRSEILIHFGNYHEDTLGCILPGRKWKDIDGDGLRDVTHSKPTMDKLWKLLPDEFYLNILKCYV